MKYIVGDTVEIAITFDVVDDNGGKGRDFDEFVVKLAEIAREFGMRLRDPKPRLPEESQPSWPTEV